MTLSYARRNLPVLYENDCVVVGGSFAGIAAALQLARRGQRVTLVEARTYLGREVTATLRPWFLVGERPIVGWLNPFITGDDPPGNPGEYPLHLDQLKIYLEDLLLLNGVNLLYASTVVQVLQEGGKARGIIVGNKSGRQAVTGHCLVDATATALLARLVNASFEPPPETALYHNTLELTGAQDFLEMVFEVPSSLGIEGNIVQLHLSHAGRNPLFVEFGLRLPAGDDIETAMVRDVHARRTSFRLAAHLLRAGSRFYWGNWSSSAYELHGFHTPHLDAAVPTWAAGYHISIATDEDIPLYTFAGALEGLWTLSEAARLAGSHELFQNPLQAAWLGDRLGEALPVEGEADLAERDGAKKIPHGTGEWLDSPFAENEPAKGLVIQELESPWRGKPFIQQTVAAQEIPILRHCESLVVGGGTGGAVAAFASSQEGADTVLAEMNPGLGGTGTLGGVVTYWMGNRSGFVPRINQAVAEIQRQLNFQPRPPWVMWNQQAKMTALLDINLDSGVTLFWNAACIGAVLEDDALRPDLSAKGRMRGAVFATRYGPVAILADVVIDATGDGDLAAFAGAEWVVGDAYEAAVMWSAFPTINSPGDGNSGNFTGAVEVGNILDLTRGILAGRRRSFIAADNHFSTWPGMELHEKGASSKVVPVAKERLIYDHGNYMAPRESRHVRGDVVMTLSDQLRHRKWHDVITVCFSNYDVKGQTTTDWNRAGLLPPNLKIEVPYRALLPREIEGLLIAGKAISARSDAVPSVRMQPDMENLGGACGIAAAIAVQSKRTPRSIDVRHLQQRLMEVGVLPEDIIGRRLAEHNYTQDELVSLAAQIQFDPAPWEYNNMPLDALFEDFIPLVEVISAGERAIPVLLAEFEHAASDRQVLLAQALALCGSQAGVDLLINRLQALFADEQLPHRQAFIFNANRVPPDQGAMPEAVYLLYSLGMAVDTRSLPVWEEVLDLLELEMETLWDSRHGVYHYVHAACYGIERLPDPRLAAPLSALHSHPVWNKLGWKKGFEPDFMLERLAGLEIAVGRAMARCGSREGYAILISYLDDVHSLLAEAAHLGLMAIAGLDLGKDPAAWRAWLNQQDVLYTTPLVVQPNINSDLNEGFFQ
jgi:ribulose 1,5-bisphosphate synthetase/thiazole synthase